MAASIQEWIHVLVHVLVHEGSAAVHVMHARSKEAFQEHMARAIDRRKQTWNRMEHIAWKHVTGAHRLPPMERMLRLYHAMHAHEVYLSIYHNLSLSLSIYIYIYMLLS